MKRLTVAIAVLVFTTSALAAAPKYHLELQANPAAPFPFLSRFGSVDIDVYPGGVRTDTVWLDGFSRVGTSTVTVMNPFGRMYTDVPLREISTILGKLAGYKKEIGIPAPLAAPLAGKVRGIEATRYRLVYGPEAWIDVWTTKSIPDNPQFRAIVDQFISGLSPATAAAARSIPGMPLYVELNFSHYKKLPLLRMKKLTFDNAGEGDALRVGMLYFKAPLLDALWK